MAATFVVEDGTGLSTANAYVSIADATTYNENHDADTVWSGAAEATQQKAIRIATQYFDVTYGKRWRGYKYSETQALDWPRSSYEDYDGYETDYDAIPTPLAEATVELAIRVNKGDDLFPVNTNPGVKSKAIHNATTGETTVYEGGSLGSDKKTYPIVEALLAGLVHQGGLVERG